MSTNREIGGQIAKDGARRIAVNIAKLPEPTVRRSVIGLGRRRPPGPSALMSPFKSLVGWTFYARPPLPAALVCRGIKQRLLRRARPQQAADFRNSRS